MVAVTTGLIYPLSEATPVASNSVLYLPAVLLVAAIWGLRLGVLTAVASAAAFNWFHLPPTGHLTIASAQNWVALVIFLVVALLASGLAETARLRAAEAERRRREAVLLAALARIALGASSLEEARCKMGDCLRETLHLESVEIEPRTVGGNVHHQDIPIHDGNTSVGTLLVPRNAQSDAIGTLRELAPSLGALLSTAQHRETLEHGVVETEALRKSDTVKTTLLRAVSHDLRSPLTAITAAAHGLSTASPSVASELTAVIRDEAARLSRLVDDLLDVSRLEAGNVEPRFDWCSSEEVINAAVEALPGGAEEIEVNAGDDLPLLNADAAQLERALFNLLDNARRHGAAPITVGARRARHSLRIRVTDRGPGIPAEERQRVFEPFYRDQHPGASGGSGLGLAIARGLVEANGGRLRAEPVPGQGISMVIELPLQAAPRTVQAR